MYPHEYTEWRCAVEALTEMERAEFEPDTSDMYGWGGSYDEEFDEGDADE
jgi:hypothetical protein